MLFRSGAESKTAVTAARETIAGTLNTTAENIYFTAGGSESDNWAIKATADALKGKGKHIITSAIEHHAVLHTCQYLEKQGFEVTYLPVDGDGIVSPQAVEAEIAGAMHRLCALELRVEHMTGKQGRELAERQKQ